PFQIHPVAAPHAPEDTPEKRKNFQIFQLSGAKTEAPPRGKFERSRILRTPPHPQLCPTPHNGVSRKEFFQGSPCLFHYWGVPGIRPKTLWSVPNRARACPRIGPLSNSTESEQI